MKTGTSSFATEGDPEEVDPTGVLRVTARYRTEADDFVYETLAPMVKLCAPDVDVTWHWTANEDGLITGTHSSPYPKFPGNSLPPAPANERERARLALSGDATLERQAFLASLELNSLSAQSVEDIKVDIRARNVYSQSVYGGFVAIPDVPTILGTLLPYSILYKEWTLIPGEMGVTNPAGEVFAIDVQIVYTYNSVVYTITTVPEMITVYPQPRVQLSFTHNQPDEDGTFYLEVQAENQGFGVAHNLVLDLSQVSVLGDLDGNGRSLVFDLLETTIDGQAESTAYIFDFGDMDPDEIKVGRWLIDVETSDGLPMEDSRITGFDVSCQHRPYQGHELSDLLFCGDLNQYFLAGECPRFACGINGKQSLS